MPSRNLVIDADVARASGGDNATHPTAEAARNFLQAVLTICHKTVMTPAIRKEWDEHQSDFARKWRRSMVARKKLIVLNPCEHEGIRQGIEAQNVPDNEKVAMLKDCHLIEAALEAGRSIVSLDNAAGKLFSDAAGNMAELHVVLWVNPVRDREEAINWLRGGAPIDGAQSQQWRLKKHAV